MRRKKRILCFGDSLTWGSDPDKRVRFTEDSRWPMVLQDILGTNYAVIEEGQNGRTIATDDPAEGEKNGLKYIEPCLESHIPLDLVIIMLGSNDCKKKFSYSALDIAGEMEIFLEKVLAFNYFRCGNHMKILLISPPHLNEAVKDSWLGEAFDYDTAGRISMELAPRYRELADKHGCDFLDAAEYVRASDTDGCHMDAENQRTLGRVIAEHITEKSCL